MYGKKPAIAAGILRQRLVLVYQMANQQHSSTNLPTALEGTQNVGIGGQIPILGAVQAQEFFTPRRDGNEFNGQQDEQQEFLAGHDLPNEGLPAVAELDADWRTGVLRTAEAFYALAAEAGTMDSKRAAGRKGANGSKRIYIFYQRCKQKGLTQLSYNPVDSRLYFFDNSKLLSVNVRIEEPEYYDEQAELLMRSG
ncbi:hypothetical protein GPALN_012340 [Globodera pallida]|nr:hypothetical protein GPALN_012340 [Globodera pallida]